jgi:Phosphotransferase enzyme family
MSRDVTLVLTDGADVFGALPTFQVPTPWWADVAVVIDAARQLTGRQVSILRLLKTSTSSSTMGGHVTYLAEVDRPLESRLPTWTGPDPLAPERHRAWWAKPGALPDAVTWATAELAETAIDVLEARPQRTWNLSVLVLLETTEGVVWLKAVPSFLADEGFVLRHLSRLNAGAGMLPTVLAHDPSRRLVLLADIPGVDLWDASAADVVELAERLVALHREGHERGLPDLVAPDVADRTATTLAAELGSLAHDGLADGPVDPLLRSPVKQLADELPARLAPLDVLPNVLVHGDPHPGNWRAGPGGARVLLDWGDVAVANPLADVAPLLARLPPADMTAAKRSIDAIVAQAFGVGDLSAATAALPLLRAVTGAVIYGRFCRNIEPDEQVYHRDDVTSCLREALAVIGRGVGR